MSDSIRPSTERYDLSKPNAVVDHLLANGPTAYTNLPTDPNTDIRRLVPLFRVRLTSRVQTGTNLGHMEQVWYLRDVHPPELVARAVLDANPSLLTMRNQDIGQQFADHADELRQAWKAIAHEYDNPQ